MITEKAHARLTLALDIVRKLDNGYHELNVIKQLIGLHDILEFEENDTIELVSYSNIPLDEHNTAYKAALLLKKRYNIKEGAQITFKKNIPAGAGLAGGSSDGAAALRGLCRLWDIIPQKQQLLELARQIGMDVPFFLYGGLCFDTEATFKIEPLPDLKRYYFLVVDTKMHVSTNEAYSHLDYNAVGKKLSALKMKQAIFEKKDIKSMLHNDFEHSVFQKYPKLKEIKEQFTSKGIPALMTGSGATVFAVFDNEKDAIAMQDKISYKTWVASNEY